MHVFIPANIYSDAESHAILDPVSIGADHENNLVPVQHNRVRSAPISDKSEKTCKPYVAKISFLTFVDACLTPRLTRLIAAEALAILLQTLRGSFGNR
jgi:hypothetical protein